MDPSSVAAVARDGLLLLATVGGPVFGTMLAVGLIVGILQSATQINDPAVGFVPRIVAAVGVCWVLGPWMVHRLAVFVAAVFVEAAGRP